MNSASPFRLMAIINATPDSFSDRHDSVTAALATARRALAAGAHILDVGGESTRPGARAVDLDTELSRVIPVIDALRREAPETVISVDTRKTAVAEAALKAGAQMINDVSGLQFDPSMAEIAARYQARLVIMHSQGAPEDMQRDPQYPEGVVQAVVAFLAMQIQRAATCGVRPENILVDPGFGFGKTVAHNLTLLRHLDALHGLGCPILAGLSRKSFLTLGDERIAPAEREALTAASLALAVQKGVTHLRLHDINTHAPVLRMLEAAL